ncbi:hypothetical protein D3C80_1546460 [compost metagenome]
MQRLNTHAIGELVAHARQRLNEFAPRLQCLQGQAQLANRLGKAVVGNLQAILTPGTLHQLALAHHGASRAEQQGQAAAGGRAQAQGRHVRRIHTKQQEAVLIEHNLLIDQHSAHGP